MLAYRGEQSFHEWLLLSRQEQLFETKITARDVALKRLTVLAVRVVDDLGRDANWTDLKESLKDRASGRIAYDSTTIAAALDAAIRERRA
ncbi:MAG TPA: hypothetical protein VNO24_28740 [Blastocatellia bacterium]|nr:hypothetical protein [Blastocatellia bacterium]